MAESDRRRLLRTDWGVVHQHPLDGLRPQVSAGGNIGERLMAIGQRHYGDIRRPPASGWKTSKSRCRASTICRPPSPAACNSGCKSPATGHPPQAGVYG